MSDKYSFIIDGEHCTSGEVLEVKNPYKSEVIGVVFRPGDSEVERSIESSVRGFQKSRKFPTYKRSQLLASAASTIDKRKEELAALLCRESGKPIKFAKAEVQRAVSTLSIASEEATRIVGETVPLDITEKAGDRLGIVRRFPVGPIAGITPFNFPLNLVCHKVAPALAAGNTISIKPATATPLSALTLGEIFLENDILPGFLNVIPCSSQTADKLVTDPRIKMITFTGSAEVGWNLKSEAGKKKVCLELGGNAAVVIEPDCDIKTAVQRSILGGFAFSGQVCISVQRIFVHEKIFDEFTESFLREVKKLILGDPLSEKTDIGPMIDEGAAIRTEEWVKEATDKGGKILTGGERDGNMFAPTVLTNVPAEARVCSAEVFAPVVVMEKYTSFEDALDKVNDSVFGLQAGVFTRDIDKAFRAFNTIEVGGVIINDVPTFRVDSMPYGGVKESGFGREGVKYALEEMTELKIMVVNHGLDR
ncbi:MAG: aldehyde dehydrogenase family protein [bacterium]